MALSLAAGWLLLAFVVLGAFGVGLWRRYQEVHTGISLVLVVLDLALALVFLLLFVVVCYSAVAKARGR